MQYKSLASDTADRIWTAFSKHTNHVNHKYNAIVGNPNGYLSDRERFATRFFASLVGKYVVFIDRLITGYAYKYFDGDNTRTASYISIDETSTYSYAYHRGSGIPDMGNVNAEPNIRMKRQYVKICRIGVENMSMRDSAVHITVKMFDGRMDTIVLDNAFLHDIQFNFISKEEFDAVSSLFSDDRDEVEYSGKRAMRASEIVDRGLEDSGIRHETVTIMARDAIEARKKWIAEHPDDEFRIWPNSFEPARH